MPAVPFSLVNRGAGPLVYSLSLDPLEREKDGASATGDLSASHGSMTISAGGAPLVIQAIPGKIINFQLAAEGLFPPGRYLSRLHIRSSDGPHSIPITISVSSHWFWAFAFILLGLLSLGLTGLLVGAPDISAKKKEALALRQSLHELLDRLPPAEANQAVAAEVDEKLTDALEHTGLPRPWSVHDWRLPRVDEDLSDARKQLHGLREIAERSAAGEVEVAKLVREWQGLEERMAAAQHQVDSPGQGLPTHFDTFLRAQNRILLNQPLAAIREQLGPHVERVRLALAAGEGNRARAQAVRVRQWVRNAAQLLDERVSLMMGWRYLCEETVARQAALEAAVYYPQTPLDVRWGLRERLKDIRWAFAREPSSLADFQKLHVRLQEMEGHILKLHSKAVLGEEALRSYRSRLASALRENLRNSGNLLALLQPNPSLAGLEEELDRLRLELDRIPEGEGIDRLVDVDRLLLEAGSRMMAVLITARDVSPEARTAAAEHGVPVAAALARRLMTEPRPLRVEPLEPAGDRHVGREITLKLQDLDPAWGPGVSIAINFGDGSTPLVMSAENIRQGARVAHRYTRPQRMTVQVVAAQEGVSAGSSIPAGDHLGHGETTLDIGPSPLSATREMTGQLFNLRFLIALGISLLLHGWRFNSERPFGARGRDYAETFALGLGTDAGVRVLADILAKIGLSG